jgi:ABC-2 type transport system permease protein
VIFGVMAGTNALAGEEANGTLDLLLAQPISRTQLVLSKMAAIAAGACLITALIYAGWLLSVPFVDIDVGFGELFWATANIVPLIVFFAAFSMWLGAALGRAPATALAAALAVSGFFISYLGELVDAVRPVRVLSVFYYNGGAKAITEGVDPARLLVLLALTAGVLLLAMRAFDQREIGVTASSLRLPRLRLHRASGSEA